MADKIVESQVGPGGPTVIERFVDNGDGTNARALVHR